MKKSYEKQSSVKLQRALSITMFIFSATLALYFLIFNPASFSPEESRTTVLIILTIGCWATGVLPVHYTSLYFFLLAMLFSISPPEVIFSGFESAAFWLIFGGLVVGVAINKTGLGQRISYRFCKTIGDRYFMIISGVVIIGIVFGFLMPSSMGRVILLIPIALALSECFGFQKGSNGRIGITLATALGCHIPAFAILPANVPNMVLAGMAGKEFNIHLLYGKYLLLHFPVIGLLKSFVIICLIVWFYPDRPQKKSMHKSTIEAITRQEKTLSIVLCIMLFFWLTDFIHHISPAWIALAGALVLLSPKLGVVSQQEFNQKINYGSLFYVAGILGLGAMVSHSGVGSKMANGFISMLPIKEGSSFLNYMSLSLTAMGTGVVTTLPGVPAVLTPLADKLSLASGLPVETILMSQVLGFSTTIFPYQSAPLIISMQLSGEQITPMVKICLVLAIITIFLLLPINFFWWQYLGYI